MKVCVALVCAFAAVYCADFKAYETVNLVKSKPPFTTNDDGCACKLFDELYQDDWMRWLPSTFEKVNNDINAIGANETAPGEATVTMCPSGEVFTGAKCVPTQ